jgi:phosphodiesterase/alkaline phosphatase D-like protein
MTIAAVFFLAYSVSMVKLTNVYIADMSSATSCGVFSVDPAGGPMVSWVEVRPSPSEAKNTDVRTEVGADDGTF